MTYYIVYDVFISKLGLHGGELNVYSAIYSAVAHLNGNISISQICQKTGVSETRVCEILKSLEERALIVRASVGYRRKNRYKLKGVKVGHKGHPLLGGDVEDLTSSEIGDVGKLTDQNFSNNRRTSSTKKLLPKVNKL